MLEVLTLVLEVDVVNGGAVVVEVDWLVELVETDKLVLDEVEDVDVDLLVDVELVDVDREVLEL